MTATLDEISDRLTRIEHLLAKRDTDRLLSAAACDRKYRMASGTAARACASGAVPCRISKARNGRSWYLIRPADADAAWGPR